MKLQIIYILAQILFLGTFLGRFSQFFFWFFIVSQPWWPTFLLSPHHKKASYSRAPFTNFQLNFNISHLHFTNFSPIFMLLILLLKVVADKIYPRLLQPHN